MNGETRRQYNITARINHLSTPLRWQLKHITRRAGSSDRAEVDGPYMKMAFMQTSYLMPILTGSVPTAAPSLKVLLEVTNNGELCRVIAPQRESGTPFVFCNTDQMRYVLRNIITLNADRCITNLSVVVLLQTGFSEWFPLESVPTFSRLTVLICCGGVGSTALSLQSSPRLGASMNYTIAIAPLPPEIVHRCRQK